MIDIEHRADDYDNCNTFVLPSKKIKAKNINQEVKTQLLSKKRRKQLENVIERKKKKLQVFFLLLCVKIKKIKHIYYKRYFLHFIYNTENNIVRRFGEITSIFR